MVFTLMISLPRSPRRPVQSPVSRPGVPRALVVAMLVALSALVACDEVPLTAPTGSTITLYVSSTVVPANGSADVTATVIESAGTAVQNGTLVSFTTNLGSIEPRDARTHDGQVIVRFNAGGLSGEAEISAVSGGAKLTGTAKIKVGGAAAGTIVLSANPATIPASGGAVQVVATVLDTNGNPLPGVPVALTTTSGALSSSMVLTDQAGEARATLTTNRAATVTANAGAKTATVNITVGAAPDVTLTPPATLVAGQPATFTVTAQPGTNSAAIQSVTVDFGDGSSANLGNLTGSTTVSKKYSSSGTYTVTVTAVDGSAQRTVKTAIVTVAAAPVLEVVLSASPTSAAINTVVTFTATLTVSGGGTVPAIRQYEWDFGDGETQTTSARQATHIFVRTGAKVVTVKAVPVEGTSASGRIDIIITP